MIGLDTNVLLRWLVTDDAWPETDRVQSQIVADLLAENRETLFVSDIVLAELAWVLVNSMRMSRDIVLKVVEQLLKSGNVVIDRREAVVAAIAGSRAGRPGFADHLIGHVNRMAGCDTTISFDKGTRGSDVFTLLPTPPRFSR